MEVNPEPIADKECALLVLSSCPDSHSADALATALVKEKLAACVNQLPGVQSIYEWQGQLQRDCEVLLLIKTTAQIWPTLRDRIQAIHPYDVPELIALPIEAGSQPYLQWLRENSRAQGDFDQVDC